MKVLIALIITLGLLFLLQNHLQNEEDKSAKTGHFKVATFPAPKDASEYPPQDARLLEAGIYTKQLEPPTEGATYLNPRDTAVVEYTGWNSATGEMFDSSVNSKPFKIRVDAKTGAIEGWIRVINQMRPGEKWRVWLPEEMAYKGSPRKELQGVLVFDMKIIDVIKAPLEPVYEDYEETPPAGTVATASGLKSLVLKQPTGEEQARAKDIVTIHITKWKRNKDDEYELVDTTVMQDRPTQLDLALCMPVYTEAISMMKEGEMRRFWVPAKLGYGENPPRIQPKGDFICDIKLLTVEKRP